jgi:hypothetical protein
MNVFDEFSLIHFAAGIIAYFWGVPFVGWMIFHIIFEYIENTKLGTHFINTYLSFWPGGKHTKESFMNSMIGDNIAAAIGWMFASLVEKRGKLSLDRRTGDTKFKKITSN